MNNSARELEGRQCRSVQVGVIRVRLRGADQLEVGQGLGL